MVYEFKSYALGSAYCALWMVSLHEFGELLGKAGCWGMFCVLGADPFVSYKG